MRAVLHADRPRETLPALGTLLRCRARLDEDRAQHVAERETLWATRPQPAVRETEGAPERETGEASAPVAEPPEAAPSAVPVVEARAEDPLAELGGWLDPLEAGAAGVEPRAATAPGRSGPLPPEVEELLARMWRPGGGPERAPRRLAATGRGTADPGAGDPGCALRRSRREGRWPRPRVALGSALGGEMQNP